MLSAAGPIDILVNNAVVRQGARRSSFTPSLGGGIAVNLSAAFHAFGSRSRDKARNWGRIINVSSIYGLRGAANRVGYVTTKTA